MFAAIAASSAGVAGVILLTRWARPAPGILQGLTEISFLSVAVVMIARSS
jgi:hypothetical protein